jgi:hypothetical protein
VLLFLPRLEPLLGLGAVGDVLHHSGSGGLADLLIGARAPPIDR